MVRRLMLSGALAALSGEVSGEHCHRTLAHWRAGQRALCINAPVVPPVPRVVDNALGGLPPRYCAYSSAQ